MHQNGKSTTTNTQNLTGQEAINKLKGLIKMNLFVIFVYNLTSNPLILDP